ncbi:phytanoyl-CoA dioxygenase family protein [Phytoactinopolyspora limicola]|uniref:phytanoyl-CoA dioxygenase family protein n=1 Tax=Phytoactinopolyspora limicola TaxID=2715536 RepID=UPI00140C86CB|nr:phytanoyl-CoA dioxygenase family protein [Phytoactinopolyspora limicola]
MCTHTMPGLRDSEIQRFRDDGFLFPVDVLTEVEAAELLDDVHSHIRDSRAEGELAASLMYGPKIHLVRRWADRLTRHPRLLAVAGSLLGPDVMVWGTNLFLKEPNGQSDLAWHQDALSYDLTGTQERAFRVWLALTPTGPENGTLRFAAGTHRLGVLQHRRSAQLSDRQRGDEVCLDLDGYATHDVVLRPGQCSLHNMLIVHGSGFNRTRQTRISVAIDYIATSVRPAGHRPDSALLVSGRDEHRNFEPETSLAELPAGRAGEEFERAVAMRFDRVSSAMRAQQKAGLIVPDPQR